MWNLQSLRRIDLRLIVILLALMLISLLVIASTTAPQSEVETDSFLTPYVIKQIQFFGVGWICFFVFSAIDYNRLREWTWIFYALMIVLLVGVFFVPSIQHVHRWYRIGGFTFQPSEGAKLICVFALSWFLDRRREKARSLSTTLGAMAIIGIPFLIILKQPDLGTALVLFPIAIVLAYFGGVRKGVIITFGSIALAGFLFISALFTGVVDHEKMRPYATKVFKDYQYERFNPNTYHQKAAITAISLGRVNGSGWLKSQFTRGKWLPAAHTDSVYPAFAEEFGLIGIVFLLGIFYGLIYVSFQVTAVAADPYGRLLSAGIAVYLAMHILVNLGMMSGLLPITGVPLVMVSYGGSSILVTMSSLGVLQSIYSRRFTF